MSMIAPPAPAPAPAPAVSSGPAPAPDFGFPPFFTTTAADSSLMAPDYFNTAYLGNCSDLYGAPGMLPMGDNSWMAALPSPDLTPTFSPGGYPLMDASQEASSYTPPFDARFNTSLSFGDAASLPQQPSSNIQNAPTGSNDDLQPIKTQSSPPHSSSSPSSPSPSPHARRGRRSRSPPTPILPEDHRARAAHNVVEKHYRRRLNAQFAALLHALPPQLRPDDDAAGKKVRKAEVLDLARQYIEALEKNGSALRRERDLLVGRVEWMQGTGLRQ